MAASATKMKHTLLTYAAPNHTTCPPQLHSATLEEESMELYIWVTASINANNDIFRHEELKEENAKDILTCTLSEHAD
eukprot:9569620-Ditylum_brightwellii.AAC.1